MALSTDATLPPFPYTGAFTSNYTTGTIQQHTYKLALSPGSYAISILPDLMVLTSATGAPTADDIQYFGPETLISHIYILRTIEYYSNSGSSYTTQSQLPISFMTRTDTLALQQMAALGYTPNYGDFSYSDASVTIEAEQTISGASSRTVYTDEYYLCIEGWRYTYPHQPEGTEVPLSGQYLITLGNPTGQRSTAWGDQWLNVISLYDYYTPPEVPISDMIQVPAAAKWAVGSDGFTFVSPQFNYDEATGAWSLSSLPAPGTYSASDATWFTGTAREGLSSVLAQSLSWMALFSNTLGAPAIVQTVLGGVSTGISYHNIVTSYLESTLGSLNAAVTALRMNSSGTDRILAQQDAADAKLLADLQEASKDALIDNTIGQNEVVSYFINLWRSGNIVKGESAEFYTFLPDLAPFVGSSHKDSMIGTNLVDHFSGGGNNDLIFGRGGNDVLDGGTGIDTAGYGGNRSAHTIVKTTTGLIVNGGSADTDTLTGIERLWFNNTKVAFDLLPTENAGMALEFMGALAPASISNPGTVGSILSFFDQGWSMQNLCKLAVDAGLVASLAGSSSNSDLVKLVYRNIIGSEASADTVDALESYLDGRVLQLSQGDFLSVIAGMELNQQHIGLAGLQQTGVEFV